jgi:hypothetical protein
MLLEMLEVDIFNLLANKASSGEVKRHFALQL